MILAYDLLTLVGNQGFGAPRLHRHHANNHTRQATYPHYRYLWLQDSYMLLLLDRFSPEAQFPFRSDEI